MIRFSQAVEYGILGLLELANAKKPSSLSAVAKKAGVPESFLAKIFQKLQKSGIIVSKRGKSGGFTFPEKSKTIDMWKIYSIIEEQTSLQKCVGESEHSCGCQKMTKCALQNLWHEAQKSLERTLKKSTIGDLLSEGIVHEKKQAPHSHH